MVEDLELWTMNKEFSKLQKESGSQQTPNTKSSSSILKVVTAKREIQKANKLKEKLSYTLLPCEKP